MFFFCCVPCEKSLSGLVFDGPGGGAGESVTSLPSSSACPAPSSVMERKSVDFVSQESQCFTRKKAKQTLRFERIAHYSLPKSLVLG